MGTKSRQYNIELLRLLAMCGIILMHMMNHGCVIMFTQPGNYSYVTCWSLFAPGMHSINILLLISGYFLVNKSFSFFRVFKLETQVLFYSLFITLGFWIFTDVPIDLEVMMYSVLPISSDFYWYASMYMGLCFLSPLINRFIRSVTKKQLMLSCILCFVLCGAWTNIIFYSSGLNVAGGVSIIWFICVYMFGAYIRLYYVPDGKWKKKLLLAVALCAFLPLSKFCFEFMQKTPLNIGGLFDDLLWGYSVFYEYNSIPVTINSIVIFTAFLNMNITSDRIGKLINTAAGASFGVYLIHDHQLVRDYLWNVIKPYDWIDHWYILPASLGCMVAIYIACMIVELLRKRLFGIWEHSDRLRGFCNGIDERMRNIWNG